MFCDLACVPQVHPLSLPQTSSSSHLISSSSFSPPNTRLLWLQATQFQRCRLDASNIYSIVSVFLFSVFMFYKRPAPDIHAMAIVPRADGPTGPCIHSFLFFPSLLFFYGSRGALWCVYKWKKKKKRAPVHVSWFVIWRQENKTKIERPKGSAERLFFPLLYCFGEADRWRTMELGSISKGGGGLVFVLKHRAEIIWCVQTDFWVIFQKIRMTSRNEEEHVFCLSMLLLCRRARADFVNEMVRPIQISY